MNVCLVSVCVRFLSNNVQAEHHQNPLPDIYPPLYSTPSPRSVEKVLCSTVDGIWYKFEEEKRRVSASYSPLVTSHSMIVSSFGIL